MQQTSADYVLRGLTEKPLDNDSLVLEWSRFSSTSSRLLTVKLYNKEQACDVEVKRATKSSDIKHFFNTQTHLRVFVWVYRFIELIKDLSRIGALSKDEIDESKAQIIRDAQLDELYDDHHAIVRLMVNCII